MEASAAEQRETEAALAFAEVEPEVVLDASFCRRPQVITNAPTPTAAGPNAMANFGRPGLKWEKSEDGIFDPLYFSSDRDRFEIDANTEVEAVYALCLDSVGSGKNRTCRGYEGSNAKYVIAGMTHTASVYELATADLVLEAEIGSLPTRCPGVVFSGSRGAQEVDRTELAAALSGVAVPAQYTEFHFYEDLNGMSASWCANPKALPEVGTNAEAPAPFVLGVTGAKMDEHFPNNNFENYNDFSHIGCLDFLPTTEKPHVCDYDRTGSFKVNRGAYAATIVEASTGTVVASAEFGGEVGCPMTVFTNPGWDDTRNATAPDEAYVYITNTVAAAELQAPPADE